MSVAICGARGWPREVWRGDSNLWVGAGGLEGGHKSTAAGRTFERRIFTAVYGKAGRKVLFLNRTHDPVQSDGFRFIVHRDVNVLLLPSVTLHEQAPNYIRDPLTLNEAPQISSRRISVSNNDQIMLHFLENRFSLCTVGDQNTQPPPELRFLLWESRQVR